MKIGICGIGRIGKTLLRKIFEKTNHNIEISIIKDLKDPNQSKGDALKNLAYLLQNDSTYGYFPEKISILDDNYLLIGEKKVYCDFSDSITDIDWDSFDIDLLVEASGNQENLNKVKACISSKLKNILITRSSNIASFTLVFGVNEDKLDINKHKVISLSTCTGNAVAPFLKVLNEEFSIKNGFLATIHPVLSSEKSLDSVNRLVQLGRASKNVKLIDTAIAKSAIEVLPNLKNKISDKSLSYRIPTDIVSSVYGVLKIEKRTNVENMISILKKKLNPKITGVCDGSFDKELVSLDYIKDDRSSILSSMRTEINDDMLSFHLWHDNEYGYCSRIYDALLLLSRK